jgi:excisionase family DNA binding protein
MATQAATQKLYDVRQTAHALGIAVPTLYRWVREGRVPCTKLSARALRFDPRSIERYISRNTIEAREVGRLA